MQVNAPQVWLTPGGPIPGGPGMPVTQVPPGAVLGGRAVFGQPGPYARPPYHPGTPMVGAPANMVPATPPQPCGQTPSLRQTFMSSSHTSLDARFEQYKAPEHRQDVPQEQMQRQVQQPWSQDLRSARAEGRPVVPAPNQQGSVPLSATARLPTKEQPERAETQRRVSGNVSTLPSQAVESTPSLPVAAQRPKGLPPFYWVPSVDLINEFEVSGACGELVTKTGNSKEVGSAFPIAGSLRMDKGGIYLWTLQVVRQCEERPQIHFGIQGLGHARPWRLVNVSRCSRSRDDGPWLARAAGDLCITEGDLIHCEADFRALTAPLGRFSFAVNDGPFEVVFEDIPLIHGAMNPVVAMGGDGTMMRLCAT